MIGSTIAKVSLLVQTADFNVNLGGKDGKGIFLAQKYDASIDYLQIERESASKRGCERGGTQV